MQNGSGVSQGGLEDDTVMTEYTPSSSSDTSINSELTVLYNDSVVVRENIDVTNSQESSIRHRRQSNPTRAAGTSTDDNIAPPGV